MTTQLVDLTQEQTQQLNGFIKDIDTILTRVDRLKDEIKEGVDQISYDLGIPKKIINKMLKTYHKNNIEALKQEDDLFYELYESVNLNNVYIV